MVPAGPEVTWSWFESWRIRDIQWKLGLKRREGDLEELLLMKKLEH
jgi:hypothetical protein